MLINLIDFGLSTSNTIYMQMNVFINKPEASLGGYSLYHANAYTENRQVVDLIKITHFVPL